MPKDPQTLGIQLSVNDEVKQDSSTSKMIFPVAAIVSFLSRFVTLEPEISLRRGLRQASDPRPTPTFDRGYGARRSPGSVRWRIRLEAEDS